MIEQATRTRSQGELRSSHAHNVTRTTAGSQLVLRASRNVGLGQHVLRTIISVNHITDGRVYAGTFKTTNPSTLLLLFLGNRIYKTISDFITYFHHNHHHHVITSVKVKVKCTLVQALRLCTGRTAHRGSRGIALLFQDHGTRRR